MVTNPQFRRLVFRRLQFKLGGAGQAAETKRLREPPVVLKTAYCGTVLWMDGRAVEGARLESAYTSKAYRGFESHSIRQIFVANWS